MPNLFAFLSFSSLMFIYANGVVWSPAFMKAQVILSIPFFAVAAFSPVHVAACLKCSGSLIKQVMISLIFTDYKDGIVLLSERVMDFYSRRERSPKYLFCNKNMLKDIAVICTWMLRIVNLKITRVVNSFSAFPGVVFVNKPKGFSLYPSFGLMVLCCQFSLLAAPALAKTDWNVVHEDMVVRIGVCCQDEYCSCVKLIGRAV